MDRGVKLKGQLRTYMQMPLYLTLLFAAMDIALFVINIEAGVIAAAFILVYLVIVTVMYKKNKLLIMNELITFATEYGQVQKVLLREHEVPYALLDDTGKIIWVNDAFHEALGDEHAERKTVFALFPDLHKEDLPLESDMSILQSNIEVEGVQKEFRLDMKRISVNEMLKENAVVDASGYMGCLIALYMFDETYLHAVIKKNKEQSLVCGLVYVDNYDEIMETVEDVRQSMVGALIERKISKYMSAFGGVVKRLEKDRYFVIFQRQYLDQLKERKVDLLTEVKTINIGNDLPLTLSIGIGTDADSYTQNYDYARTAIDLALGRGGDQAVIKEGSSLSYYGGKSKQLEKTTRVKARVKAQALREILQSKGKVIVMGHKISDSDAFGAAVGIYRAAKSLNKKVNIVLNDVTSSLKPMVDAFLQAEDDDEDIVITRGQAIERADSNTVVVVVDTNRPSYTECPELLSKCRSIVVFDHHRRSAETIENATLSYIEPYASSACEMVAEILQYFAENLKLKPAEADCLYAGLMIDTDNFANKTGVRTFEAAAYLKRSGADIIRIRKMLRNDMTEYKARAEAVRSAEVYGDYYAISTCPSEGLESPTVVGAQAANELLNINGIKASFVLTEYEGKIYISARAIDEVNVQLIMERLGGGGHMTIAGAQLENMSITDAIAKMKETLAEMQKEGDL